MAFEILIRPITADDASSISLLSKQLGYDINIDTLTHQIERIIKFEDQYAFIAEFDGQPLGYIHGFISYRLTSPAFLEIGGLIVDEAFQRRGIAKSLVQQLEAHVTEISKIRVRCNLRRSGAHAFYHKLGYEEIKEQKVFAKQLLPSIKS